MDNVESIAQKGAMGVNSLKELVENLPTRRVIWLMIPAGDIVERVIDELSTCLDPTDIIIDGGNSNYKKSIRRYEKLKEKKIDFLDCGTSRRIHSQVRW